MPKKLEDMVTAVNAFEYVFARNNYDGGGSPITITSGCRTVAITTPHSVNQVREGKLKYAERLTGGISRYVQDLTQCSSIAKSFNDGSDANQDADCTFKDQVCDYIRTHQITHVLDLHGASAKRPFDIELGTNYGELMDAETVAALVRIFHANGIENVTVDSVFPASSPNRVARRAHMETGCPSVQIEVNGRFRNPANVTELTSLINALSEIVFFLSAE